MKTNELTEDALDWAVATIEYGGAKNVPAGFPAYSKSWAQGGPIIEREKIRLGWVVDHWNAYKDFNYNRSFYGRDPKHPLIAAMRCYVASKLGDEVDVPEELTP